MKRLYFTPDDLSRVRVGAPLGALGETLLATRTVQRSRTALFEGWRSQVVTAMPENFGVLADLVPADGSFLDLITPTRGARTMSEGITALHLASREELRREVIGAANCELWPPTMRLPDWAANLPDRDNRTLSEVAAAFESFHSVAFADRWTHVQSYLDVAVDRMARTMATEGVEGLFATLAPYARWRAPVLEVATRRVCRDRHLDGRGLVLVPALFVWPEPILLHSTVDETLPLTMVVPAIRDMADFATAWGPRTPNEALNALLGRTRAAALQAIAEGCSTTELARQLGVTPATASEHASILREAGLIDSQRHRNAMRHQLTTLGAALLDGDLETGLRIA
ncbi:winged helix-turn-helix domain-containing protein [Nocardia goodfellowii]|uniref:DNA-binding transcriptional ArsR family regulator n=1 Tax=Nocardia goodfellowii TaxID=882446 RepID=A0ABS4QD49_9NOCA|nr:winged helix-turn-helix domain-containing protein [Nocardia goodfellowii]MBP2189038.1 DNA-binding transcriptional ArsR family regulator [Nocardia goodfellowii]